MRTIVTEQPATTPSGGDWETSRRDKLRRIVEMGRDPWGSRFDDHASIAAIRGRTNEIVLRLQDGREVALPDLATAAADPGSEALADLTAIDGIGEVVAEGLVGFFKEPHNQDIFASGCRSRGPAR